MPGQRPMRGTTSGAGAGGVAREGGGGAAQQQRRRRQRRAEVLDSSDEEGSTSTGADDNRNIGTATGDGNDRRRPSPEETGTKTAADGEGSSSEDFDDDELMNPYVMNPFNGNDRMDNYSAQALLPPSMEMAAISRGGGMQSGRSERGIERAGSAEAGSFVDSSASTPVRANQRERAALAGFDPYGPNRINNGQYGLEMEEESIEFLSPNRDGSKNANRSTSHGQPEANALNVFGPLLDEPEAPPPPEESFGSSSFSPFPKHRSSHSPNQYVGASGERYGEDTPLSSSSGFSGRGGSTAPVGEPGIVGALVNVVKAVASSAAYSASTLLYGDQRSQSANPNNPFSTQRRVNVRMSQSNRKHWGMLAHFRLFAISLAALYCVGTMTAVWNVPSAGDGVEVVEKNAYTDNDATQGKTSSIVLKKMKKAKQHWWSRNKAESNTGNTQQQLKTEIYRNGEKEAAGVQEQVQQQQMHHSQKQHQSNASKEALPAVIVQTEEDGTMIIRLPPPQTNMEQPEARMGAAAAEANEAPLGSSVRSGGDEEETMYIKLPYPQQLGGQRRTLTEETKSTMKRELEPPLRGAAPQPSHRSLLKHFVPPPLAETDQNSHHHHHHRRAQGEHVGVLGELRSEFHQWMQKHDKKYGSHEEKERRFDVWRKNHVRIKEKNMRHGPCRMTGKAVFGHNLFSDLDPEEFQSKFLTGYRGPRSHDHDRHGHKKKKRSHFRETTADEPPAASVMRHPSIQRKLEEHTATYGSGGVGASDGGRLHGSKYQASFANGCKWWDVSCYLRWIFGYQYVGGTREPVYDENSYPSALDWRSMGVVTDVHSQGSCGACWAITAVETIESAYAIASGNLIDLDEEEVIACDGTCEMCNGGWPQNAYEYAMKHNGLKEKSSDYDADWLYTVTAVLAGESYEASEYDMGSYFAATCPSGYREGEGGGSGSRSQHSGDNNGGYEYDVSYVESTRYGKVKGYGYATDRCICYTDGSGCDCDDQDEKTAVLNVASYGPAAVCLEASLWQDYEGGIMTSDTGCSKSFLDMNHCVEVVGYAFTDGSDSDNEGENGNNGGSGSGSGSNDRSNKSNKSGSRDSQRDGYWIVKNQWSNYWGMNGYAYVAMGDNTCGILNDMTQVYM